MLIYAENHNFGHLFNFSGYRPVKSVMVDRTRLKSVVP